VKGFSLLEVLIALAIMAGVVMTVIVSFNYHLGIVARDKSETEAVLLGRAKIDDPGFKSLPYGKGDFAPARADITWEKKVTETECPGITRMTLTISWDSSKRNLTLVRYASTL